MQDNPVRRIAQMMDLSTVRADHTFAEIELLAETAKKYDCLVVYTLPSYIPYIKKLLGERTDIIIGGAVGFPSGGDTTAMKIEHAKTLIAMGCGELDMVQNIGFAVSGMFEQVEADIHAVKQAAGDVPLKVILECHYLSDDQIVACSEACVAAGAEWVKTGTGWPETGATFENIALIKKTVGDRALVKASGGVADLDTLLKMYELGTRRFGIGLRTAQAIFDEAQRRVADGDPLFNDAD